MVDQSVKLRGLGPNQRAMILQRIDSDFIDSMLSQLADPNGLTTVSKAVAKKTERGDALKLYQPIHHTFHIALYEILCDDFLPPGIAPGFLRPRLDPSRIESSGLV